jgi:hypothetical protein
VKNEERGLLAIVVGISAFCSLGMQASSALAAGPKIHIVIAAEGDPLEKFAAVEMSGQLEKLFGAESIITSVLPKDAENVILLGNPATHGALKKLSPALSMGNKQSHALKSVKIGEQTALAVAGGGPQAVMWASYELGWQFGIRYFTFGDLYPTAPPAFRLDGFDLKLEPRVFDRDWRIRGHSDISPHTAGIDEMTKIIRQLAKLKFNHVTCKIDQWMWGPYEARPAILVGGDTVGRSAFGGAKLFVNPDVPPGDLGAGRRYIMRLRDAAFRCGLEYHGDQGPANHAGTSFGIPAVGMGVLPRIQYQQWHDAIRTSPGRENYGFSFECDHLDDAQLDIVYISRAAFDAKATPEHVCEEMLTPICGEEVHVRVKKAFDFAQSAYHQIEEKDVNEGFPHKDMLLRHYESDEPPPAWWGEVRTNYLNAMNEMYRANTRAREGGRQFTLWYARRFEFAMEYMNVVEALRKAGIAKRKGNKEEQIAELEKALDSITGACNAIAAVARSQSDRGIIAVMNEYGYRPVTKLLEEADAEK